MRRTAKMTVATGAATGALVVGGAAAFAFFQPSGTMSDRSDDGQAATAARTSESDDSATMTQPTFTDEEGTQATATFDPDEQGDRMSAMHSQGNGANDPDDSSQTSQTTSSQSFSGDRDSQNYSGDRYQSRATFGGDRWGDRR